MLNAGTRVVILAGRGCLGAREEVLALAETLGAPIVKPLLGKAVVPDDSPFTTGGIGLLGTAPSQDAMEECDTLLIAGSSFPYLEFYPKPGQAKTIQIEIDATRTGLRHAVDVGLVGDCRHILQALLPLIERKADRTFLEKAQERMKKWNQLMELRGTRTDLPLKPQVVAHQLNALLRDDAIVSADSGTIATWAARHIRMRGTMQFSLSGTLATMANSVPYSVGAAVAFPGRQVVAIVGDGGFTMLMGELATLVKYQLPVKVIIFKNNVLGMIKWEQMVLEGNAAVRRRVAADRFRRVCRAPAAPAALPSTIRPRSATCCVKRFDHPGPAIVEAVVDPNEPPLPGKITTDQAWKFTEVAARRASAIAGTSSRRWWRTRSAR